jgi:hypothetical protein
MLLVPAQYTDDRGGTWTVSIGQEYFAQAALGWAEAVATDPPLRLSDRAFKPRCVLVRTSSGESRRIICGSKTSTAYLGTTATINTSKDDNVTQYVSTVYGYEGERRRFRRPDAPAQA